MTKSQKKLLLSLIREIEDKTVSLYLEDSSVIVQMAARFYLQDRTQNLKYKIRRMKLYIKWLPTRLSHAKLENPHYVVVKSTT